MLTIYKRLWQVNWAEQWQYRANLLMYLFYWLVSPIVYLAVWTTIANSKGTVSGLTANDFITYYLTLLIVDQLTSEITIHILAYKIQDGTLSGELLRPMHPILTGSLVNNLAFKLLNLLAFIPIWLVLALLFRPDYSGVTAGSILLAIPGILLGFWLNFLVGRDDHLRGVLDHAGVFGVAVLLHAGGLAVRAVCPAAAHAPRRADHRAQFLPFQMFRFVPIEIILNRMSLNDVLINYAISLVWLVAFSFLFRWVWREGVKRFSAVGA